jgi:hypothetical protein
LWVSKLTLRLSLSISSCAAVSAVNKIEDSFCVIAVLHFFTGELNFCVILPLYDTRRGPEHFYPGHVGC